MDSLCKEKGLFNNNKLGRYFVVNESSLKNALIRKEKLILCNFSNLQKRELKMTLRKLNSNIEMVASIKILEKMQKRGNSIILITNINSFLKSLKRNLLDILAVAENLSKSNITILAYIDNPIKDGDLDSFIEKLKLSRKGPPDFFIDVPMPDIKEKLRLRLLAFIFDRTKIYEIINIILTCLFILSIQLSYTFGIAAPLYLCLVLIYLYGRLKIAAPIKGVENWLLFCAVLSIDLYLIIQAIFGLNLSIK